MADISKIDVGGTTYDIKDATAREAAAAAAAAAKIPNGMKYVGRVDLSLSQHDVLNPDTGSYETGPGINGYKLGARNEVLLHFGGDINPDLVFKANIFDSLLNVFSCKFVICEVSYAGEYDGPGAETFHHEICDLITFNGTFLYQTPESIGTGKPTNGSRIVYEDSWSTANKGYGPYAWWLQLSDATRNALASSGFDTLGSPVDEYMLSLWTLSFIGYN